jgi:hypothetical protein
MLPYCLYPAGSALKPVALLVFTSLPGVHAVEVVYHNVEAAANALAILF